MKSFLVPHLICPACLPKERPLTLSAGRERDGEIVSGYFSCPSCPRRFPIEDGVALLVPEPEEARSGGAWRYQEQETLNRYLWSHYADLHGDPENEAANAAWAGCLAQGSESALDAGCSVGRVVFEMAARSGWAVGCDLSLSFVRSARRLAAQRQLTYSLPLEGKLRETFRIRLPDTWRGDNLEFLVADALRLPFAAGTFRQSASLNVLDRIGHPLRHLCEMNRTACREGASLLLASPFSWASSDIPEQLWLGGTATGPYRGRGADNVRSLLEGKGRLLSPPWRVVEARSITWKLRSHRNHCEHFNSEVIVAVR